MCFGCSTSPSNVTVTGAPSGFSMMPGRLTLESVSAISPRKCGAPLAPVITTIVLAIPSIVPGGMAFAGIRFAMCAASPLIRTAKSRKTLLCPL